MRESYEFGIDHEHGDFSLSQKEAEREEKNVHKEYLHGLGLSERDLRGKRVLDIGAGARLFASRCHKKNIDADIYSLDIDVDDDWDRQIHEHVWSDEVRRNIDSRTVQADYRQLPFRTESFDLVVAHCSVPGGVKDLEYYESGLENTLAEMCRVIKPGGEVRIYPIIGKRHGPDDQMFKESLERILKNIEELNGYDVTCEKVDKGWVVDSRGQRQAIDFGRAIIHRRLEDEDKVSEQRRPRFQFLRRK